MILKSNFLCSLHVGFQTFFTIQGYRCLEPYMFLQYVDHGVLRLTEEFMTHLIQEVPDDTEEEVNMKVQIISRLPKVRKRIR